MNIRNAALDWFRSHHPSQAVSGGIVRASKYFVAKESWTGGDAWWVQVPLSDVERGVVTHILCEQAPGARTFRYLRVPASFFSENLRRFALVGKNRINLFLSAEPGHEFQDRRGAGAVAFAHFEQGAPARNGRIVLDSIAGAARGASPTPATVRHSPLLGPPAPVAVASLTEWVAQVCADVGAKPESAEYLAAVETWRTVWRPSTVRVLLVAESHVTEQAGDEAVRVVLPRAIHEPIPQRYCRLVYCLGYGDASICSPKPQPGGGTPQYWDLFNRIAFGDAASPVVSLSDKLRVLRQLRDDGVWLVDASVAGVYDPALGDARFKGSVYAKVVRDSYERFVVPALMSEHPTQIWTIGKTVANALSGAPFIDAAKTILQPNQRNASRRDEYVKQRDGLVAEIRALTHPDTGPK